MYTLDSLKETLAVLSKRPRFLSPYGALPGSLSRFYTLSSDAFPQVQIRALDNRRDDIDEPNPPPWMVVVTVNSERFEVRGASLAACQIVCQELFRELGSEVCGRMRFANEGKEFVASFTHG